MSNLENISEGTIENRSQKSIPPKECVTHRTASEKAEISKEPEDNFYYDELALKIWELLDQALTIRDIATSIASEFEIDLDRALAHTREHMEMFGELDPIAVRQQSS